MSVTRSRIAASSADQVTCSRASARTPGTHASSSKASAGASTRPIARPGRFAVAAPASRVRRRPARTAETTRGETRRPTPPPMAVPTRRGRSSRAVQVARRPRSRGARSALPAPRLRCSASRLDGAFADARQELGRNVRERGDDGVRDDEPGVVVWMIERDRDAWHPRGLRGEDAVHRVFDHDALER